MTLFEAIVLGIIQGLTEFLPVSSSGHLEIAHVLFGIRESDNLLFAIAVHGATVLSTIVVFWNEISRLVVAFFRFRMSEEMQFIINIFISLIPVVVVGLFFKEEVESLFTGNLLIVGIMLVVTSVLLTISSYVPSRGRRITPRSAFLMGLAQAAAVLPGLSRSGSTISTGLMCGVKPQEVAKFSFLMVLIPIIGVNVLELVSGEFAGSQSVSGGNIAAGAIAAFVSGTIACKWMINIVKRGKLVWFAVYCLIVGVASILYTIL